MTKKTSVFVVAVAIVAIAILILQLRTSDFFNVQYVNAHRVLMFPLITISALIDSINPCAISVLFITIAFLMSLGKVRQDIVQIGGTYIFGIFVIYVLIGLGVLKALSFFGTPHFMARIGAGVLIIFGTLELINYFFPSFPIKLKIPNSAHGTMARFMEKGSVPAAFILGALVGMYEFPCTGGPYLLVLGLLHDGATFLQGFFYLAWYNIVFVAPLVAILLIASNRTVFEKVQAWRKENVSGMQLWTGMAFIVLAVLILVL